jgi:3-hydroxyisobutyrate dehydrogenase-like beta-hydroxyacid dehydrogenase
MTTRADALRLGWLGTGRMGTAMGLTAGSVAPKIVVDWSTVSADASAVVRSRLAERGTALLAAPVMGNPWRK